MGTKKAARRELSQSDKFRVAARELGVDQSPDAFKKVIRQIGSVKPEKPAKKEKTK